MDIFQQSQDLAGLEQLTRVSHKFRSELDAGYFERIGEGSFGYVYKAKKGGQTVAVKILKNKEDSKHIEYFEREVDMLRLASENVMDNSFSKQSYMFHLAPSMGKQTHTITEFLSLTERNHDKFSEK